ncbi:MAG: hypothetical protein KC535_03500 [Nanoarchaeota archaeon]|nr:hypothetical protein [Nanoarchaeota archaeon]
MKRWPLNLYDSKDLYISIVASSIIAIVVVTQELLEVLFPQGKIAGLITLFILLWFIFFKFLGKYSEVRETLAEIDSKSSKKKR